MLELWCQFRCGLGLLSVSATNRPSRSASWPQVNPSPTGVQRVWKCANSTSNSAATINRWTHAGPGCGGYCTGTTRRIASRFKRKADGANSQLSLFLTTRVRALQCVSITWNQAWNRAGREPTRVPTPVSHLPTETARLRSTTVPF
ncbi:AGAP010863-PA [Anopheles gambiae str. PEST]|uniref:AGAP010863-PA n=1 Tax=Anopheles gambiae TaxID=7165 RepID=Q7QGR3_ANOGA|nr:AGAP010863-PA [Anopheles gambiae str. PEST]